MRARPIYLDHAATTPVDPRVVEAMLPYLHDKFGNPASSTHAYGWEADEAVQHAREQVAALLNADSREIVWTSGATEGNNLAIKGAAHFHRDKGRHIITLATEHKAVLDTVRELERTGFEATYIDPGPDGILALHELERAIRPDTILVSVMMVNNEIGVIQDIEAIGRLCRKHGVMFHCDAVQAAGKVDIDLSRLPVDLLTITAHKVYGPKGIGALYVRRRPRVRLVAQIHGGGHERGMRSGTLPTHQIVGMGKAFEIARAEMADERIRIRRLRDKLLDGLMGIEALRINGDLEKRIPHNLNVSVPFVEGESLLMDLDELAVSNGSACTSSSLEPSHVLRSLGVPDELAHSSLRITLGRFTTEDEIDRAIHVLHEKIARLRAISPLWELYRSGVDPERHEWRMPHGAVAAGPGTR